MRISQHLSRKAATTLLHSARTAAAIGREFNVWVCISTWELGIAAEDATSQFQKMRRQQFGRWSNYKPRNTKTPKNGSPTDTWVFDAPGGRHHVHWMLHIRPENRDEFELKLERWVRSMSGVKANEALPAGAVDVAPVTNPEGAKLYMAKGTDPFYGKLWNIRFVDCGTVYGNRAGTARALGPSVWRPLKRAYQAQRGQKNPSGHSHALTRPKKRVEGVRPSTAPWGQGAASDTLSELTQPRNGQ